jgi:hypothetical protein
MEINSDLQSARISESNLLSASTTMQKMTGKMNAINARSEIPNYLTPSDIVPGYSSRMSDLLFIEDNHYFQDTGVKLRNGRSDLGNEWASDLQ